MGGGAEGMNFDSHVIVFCLGKEEGRGRSEGLVLSSQVMEGISCRENHSVVFQGK